MSVSTFKPLTLAEPLSIDDGRQAAQAISRQRRSVEESLEQAVKDAADAEVEYRKAYANAFIDADGTAAEREAKAKKASAKECRERDIKAGMVKVMQERLRGLEGERSLLKSLIDWSAGLNRQGIV